MEDRVVPAAGDFGFAIGAGSTGTDIAYALAADTAGNTYVTGHFAATVDFDPGAAVNSLTAAGVSLDTFVAKYSPAGALVWARRLGGTAGADVGHGIAVDAAGNVLTTGWFEGTADFDPGAGTLNLTSAGQQDIFVSKLDSNGNFVYAHRFGASSDDRGRSIAVDGLGNAYLTGHFLGTADFDPGAGISNLTSFGSSDIFVSKLDSAGNFVYIRQLGGLAGESGYDIAVDSSGNVYTTGAFSQFATDFDPGPGTFNLTGSGAQDPFVSKLDSAGNFVWARQLGGTSNDFGRGIAVDGSGNVYTTGFFAGTVDFDPGVGINNLTSFGNEDIYVSKLDSAGNFVYARKLGGTNTDAGDSIAVDGSGNVHVTGLFAGTADFDPGAGTNNLTSGGIGTSDSFVSKLDSAGNFVYARQLGGAANEEGLGIALDGAGSVYTSGYFTGTADFDPGAGVFNLTSAGGLDIFVSKLQGPTPDNQTITFGPLAAKTYGDADFIVSATASSGLPVTFTATGDATVLGNVVHITGAGSATITAHQAGDTNYNAAPDVSQSFTINKADQTITVTIPAPASAVYNTTFNVAATSSSGLAVGILASGVGSGTGSGSAIIHMDSGTGTATVTFSQAGNANYNAATAVIENVAALKADQIITVTTPAPTSAVYNTTFNVAATSSSGLAVGILASGVGSGSGSGSASIHMDSGTGTANVTFSQAGDANYNAAMAVIQNVAAQKADQTITFGPLSGKNDGDADFVVSASASSGLSATFTATGAATATSGGLVHITGAGSATITAHQVGDSNYNAAPDVSQSFSINALPTFSNLAATSPINENGVTKLTGTITDPANQNNVTLFSEDFEAYAEGSNLIGQGGWTENPFNDSHGTVTFVGAGAGLGTMTSNGRLNTGIGKLTFADNVFAPGGLAPTSTYTLSFDACSHSYSSAPPTHNAGVYFRNTGGQNTAGWFSINGSTWVFDVRFLTGNAANWQFFGGGQDAPVAMQVVLDPVNHEVYGLADFGGPTIETTHYTMTAAQFATLDGVTLHQDYRNPGAFLGAEFDNIAVTSTTTILESHNLVVDWADSNSATFALPATDGLSVGQMIASSTDTSVLEITGVNSSTGAINFAVQHQYLDDNPTATPSDIYTIGLTITDGNMGSASGSTSVTVNNVNPTFEAGPDQTLLPPVVGVFSRGPISFTDPGTLDVWSGTVNFGDDTGTQALSVDQVNKQFNLSHTYTQDGVYTVTVTLKDDDGSPVTDTFQVTVILNTPPVAGDDSVTTDEDHAVTFDVLGNDEDEQNNIVASLTIALTSPAAGVLTNNGDGTFGFDPDGDFDYLAAGESSQVTFGYRIEDSFGETDTATVTITINGANDGPSVGVANATVTVDEGQIAANSGAFGDIDLSDVVSVTASVGTITQGNGTWSWTFDTSDGPTESQSVTITADDGNGGIATTTFDLIVNNVAPTVTISGPASGVRGQAQSFTGSFTDPGADTHTTSWQVFNSSNTLVASGTGLGFTFTPTASGVYTVTLTVTDDDGGVGSASQSLSVTAVALQTDSCDPTKTMLVVGGTLGDDDIVLSPVGNGETVEVTLNGVSQGTFAPTGRLVVYAQDGNDNVQVAGSITNSAWLFGGAGHDRLKGGNGHDVLLGGAGDDLVIGGQGRDLLIGGVGSDRIVGNADEDILIAGSTAYDDVDHALCSLMREWTSGNDYATRVANVTAGTGLTNGYHLNGNDGANQTVFEDNSADVLTGSQGQDWFFANRVADNGAALDKVTDQAANELWSDTDF